MKATSYPIWPIAILCALLPFIAVHTSWALSIYLDYVPSCFPYLEGCTSISRSARYGIANHIFRMIMLPAATIQIITWLITWQWLKKLNENNKAARSLPYLGIAAGIFLSLYVTFLGTEGDIYQLLRRYGVSMYFGLTYIAQLVVHYNLKPFPDWRLPKVMLGLCLTLLPIGLASLYFSATLVDPLKDRAENISEWNLAALMILWFVFLSIMWHRLKVKIQVL